MNLNNSFLGGFLVLGFVIFIVGLLSGMLMIALVPAKPDFTELALVVFLLGFVTGMLITAFLMILRLRRKTIKLINNPVQRATGHNSLR